MAEIENWKPVKHFEGLYEVSDLGRVRNARNGFVKTPSTKATGGYKLIGLCRAHKCRSYSLHSLVAEAFHGPRPDGTECCHLNGDPADNRAANLAYATRKENHAHKYLHGTDQRGERHNQAKLTDALVLRLRAEISANEQVRAKASELGMADTAIYAAVTGKTWRHLPNAHPLPRSPRTKLTDSDAERIRQSSSDIATRKALAAEMGVSPHTVWCIQTGRQRVAA